MHPTIARLLAEDAGSAASRASSGFGGSEFWASLRQVTGLDAEVRALLADARSVLRRRIVLPLMVGRSQLRMWLAPWVPVTPRRCVLVGCAEWQDAM